MNAGDWIALAGVLTPIEGAVIYGAVKVSRLADAVDRLEKSMSRLDDLDKRIMQAGL